MHLKKFGRVAASIALAGAVLVPTATFATAASGDINNPITLTPSNISTYNDSDTQLVVGQPTEVGQVPASMVAATVWFRGATVVGTADSYTPVAADRGQVIHRVITYTSGGTVVMTMTQTFLLPVA